MKICSKCGENKELKCFNKNKSRPDGLQNYCKKCKAKLDNKWIEENPSKWGLLNQKRNERRNNIIFELRNLKGGCCLKCGYNKCLDALDFHHLDPDQKEFGISGKLLSFKKLKVEADKCILLCANCHREFHSLERKKGINIEEYLNGEWENG